MKNETSVNNSKYIINNSSMLTAENSSKQSKFNLKRNKYPFPLSQKYSNTALFENPKREHLKTISHKKSQKGIYLTDVTFSKFRETELDTKTTFEVTNPYYTKNNQLIKNRNRTARKSSKNSLPNIKSNGLTRYINNVPFFTCCNRKANPVYLTYLYNQQLSNIKDNKNNENNQKKGKKTLKEDKIEFLRKTNEIKRIKYEIDLKKEAIEDFKENLKMQKYGIDFTISNLKAYRDNLENNFLNKYNDNLRKLGKVQFELKLKSDKENNELILLKKEVASLKNLLIKKENMLKIIEKWIYLQIYIKEGEEPKNLNNSLKKYNNQLIFDSLEELNNTLTYIENRNLRLMEKFNKSQIEKDKYISELLEIQNEAKNIDKSIDLAISQKESLLSQLKERENNLNKTIKNLNKEKKNDQDQEQDKETTNKRSKSLNNKMPTNNHNYSQLRKNELGILYKPINIENNILIYIDSIYINIISNNIQGLDLDSTFTHQLHNINTTKNQKAVIKMKIIEISLNYLIDSINKKIKSDKNCLNIMEKTCKLIDLYHKKINGDRNREQQQKNRDNLLKKVEDKNKKAYYLPRGKIEKYNVVSIQKKKNEEKMKKKKVIKKIDIWDFLHDQSYNEIESDYNETIED